MLNSRDIVINKTVKNENPFLMKLVVSGKERVLSLLKNSIAKKYTLDSKYAKDGGIKKLK